MVSVNVGLLKVLKIIYIHVCFYAWKANETPGNGVIARGIF